MPARGISSGRRWSWARDCRSCSFRWRRITVDPIPQEEMGYATSLIALARNLGAGIGISVFTAFVARREQFHQVRLAASTAHEHGLAARRARGAARLFGAAGRNSARAAHQALALIYHQLLQEASALSYLDGFRIIAPYRVPFGTVMRSSLPLCSDQHDRVFEKRWFGARKRHESSFGTKIYGMLPLGANSISRNLGRRLTSRCT